MPPKLPLQRPGKGKLPQTSGMKAMRVLLKKKPKKVPKPKVM